MPGVLTTESKLKCPHQGSVHTSGSSKLKVNGKGVLLQDGIKNKRLDGNCTVKTDESKNLRQCGTVLSVSAGFAQKLKAEGAAVMLETLVALTNGAPPATGNHVTAEVVQTKLTAV